MPDPPFRIFEGLVPRLVLVQGGELTACLHSVFFFRAFGEGEFPPQTITKFVRFLNVFYINFSPHKSNFPPKTRKKPVYTSMHGTVMNRFTGQFLRMVLPPFTLATIIGVSITPAASSPAVGCCYGYFTVFISA